MLMPHCDMRNQLWTVFVQGKRLLMEWDEDSQPTLWVSVTTALDSKHHPMSIQDINSHIRSCLRTLAACHLWPLPIMVLFVHIICVDCKVLAKAVAESPIHTLDHIQCPLASRSDILLHQTWWLHSARPMAPSIRPRSLAKRNTSPLTHRRNDNLSQWSSICFLFRVCKNNQSIG